MRSGEGGEWKRQSARSQDGQDEEVGKGRRGRGKARLLFVMASSRGQEAGRVTVSYIRGGVGRGVGRVT